MNTVTTTPEPAGTAATESAALAQKPKESKKSKKPKNTIAAAALDLAAPQRTVRLKFGSRTARHVFRRLRCEDWLEFIKAARTEMIFDRTGWTQESHADAACIALWNRAVLRVEGYKVGPKGTSDDWKEKMPAHHKIAAVGLLQEVAVVPSEDDENQDFDLEADRRTVTLEAAWNERVHKRLDHLFHIPRQQDVLEYRRTLAESYRQQRPRAGAIHVQFPPRLKQMVALYDRLIDEVRGYTGLNSPRDMDALHKQAAVLALFEPPAESEEEE